MGEDLYVYYCNGIGTSKLTNALLEKTLQTHGSARNWNTLSKLAELASRVDESKEGVS
jgi:uncharacterized protein (DUF1697 family)